jgi:hypothetical protein
MARRKNRNNTSATLQGVDKAETTQAGPAEPSANGEALSSANGQAAEVLQEAAAQPPAAATRALAFHPRTSAKDERIIIHYYPNAEFATVQSCLIALAQWRGLFQRGHILVMLAWNYRRPKAVAAQPDIPTIIPVPKARLREESTRYGAWECTDEEGEDVPCAPRECIIDQVFDRKEYDTIRQLTGVVEAPVFRPDGSILERDGYDGETGLLHVKTLAVTPIPVRPSKADALAARDDLYDIIKDFHFVEESRCAHMAAWLAALLTPFARPAISGPVPGFLFDGSMKGTGKTMLADIISVLVTGRPNARITLPSDEDEVRKLITAMVMAGGPLVLFDDFNLPALKSPSLDAVLTGTTWKGRILGLSKMTDDLPLLMTWIIAGNNITVEDQMARRVVPCRLESKTPEPEKRNDFHIDGDLLDYVKKNRARLVRAALIILRAYWANKPTLPSLTRFGSYDSWSQTVRSAVYWITEMDPVETRSGLEIATPDVEAGLQLLLELRHLPGATTLGITAQNILQMASDWSISRPELQHALVAIGPKGELPTAKELGEKLTRIRDRLYRTGDGTVKLVGSYDKHAKRQQWIVAMNTSPQVTEHS